VATQWRSLFSSGGRRFLIPMSIVYIPNVTMRRATADGPLIPSFDYTPAMQYGEIKVLVPSGTPHLETKNLLAWMRSQLLSFSDDDYIVAAGEPATLAAACLVAAELNDGRIKMLRWDKHSVGYHELQFDLKGEMNVTA
jgi:hypothetical protein